MSSSAAKKAWATRRAHAGGGVARGGTRAQRMAKRIGAVREQQAKLDPLSLRVKGSFKWTRSPSQISGFREKALAILAKHGVSSGVSTATRLAGMSKRGLMGPQFGVR